jgi:ABC-type branched-subunit amino acid transport system permease subunit
MLNIIRTTRRGRALPRGGGDDRHHLADQAVHGFRFPPPLGAILGGIGSVQAIIGGLIVGVSEALAVQFVGADYRAAVAFVILIVVLLVRPAGLLGLRQ